jgi:hypothetical protein
VPYKNFFYFFARNILLIKHLKGLKNNGKLLQAILTITARYPKWQIFPNISENLAAI